MYASPLSIGVSHTLPASTYGMEQYYWIHVLHIAKPTFTVDDLPDQTGRIAIVTGSNVGIGKETCRVLLEKNCKVCSSYPSSKHALYGRFARVVTCEISDIHNSLLLDYIC